MLLEISFKENARLLDVYSADERRAYFRGMNCQNVIKEAARICFDCVRQVNETNHILDSDKIALAWKFGYFFGRKIKHLTFNEDDQKLFDEEMVRYATMIEKAYTETYSDPFEEINDQVNFYDTQVIREEMEKAIGIPKEFLK